MVAGDGVFEGQSELMQEQLRRQLDEELRDLEAKIPLEVREEITAAVRRAVEARWEDPGFLTERYIRLCFQYWRQRDLARELERFGNEGGKS